MIDLVPIRDEARRPNIENICPQTSIQVGNEPQQGLDTKTD
jgi:hypothetical protein